MNRFYLLSFLLLFAACDNSQQESQATHNNSESQAVFAFYGDTIETDNVVNAVQLEEEMGNAKSQEARVEGVVKDVCQAKGCWMTVDIGEGETMRVTFKDYGFFVPKDAAGKTVIFEGTAEKEMVDVETQRHYAADAGQSPEEIEKIKEPRAELTFVAEGVAFPEEGD